MTDRSIARPDTRVVGGVLQIEDPEINPAYPDQRWFGRRANAVENPGATVFVYRHAKSVTADLDLCASAEGIRIRGTVVLTPDECRRVAAQLLSAALDIEQNPPESLK